MSISGPKHQWRRFGSKSGGTRNSLGRVRVEGRWQSLYIGSATILRMGYKTVLRAERAEIFFEFLPQIVTFLRYISRKWSQKIVEYIRFEGKRHFVSPPIAMCLAKSGGGDKLHYGPPPEILGGLVPPSLRDLRHCKTHTTWLALICL